MNNHQDKTEKIVRNETARFNYKGIVKINQTSSNPCFSGNIRLLTDSPIMEINFFYTILTFPW